MLILDFYYDKLQCVLKVLCRKYNNEDIGRDTEDGQAIHLNAYTFTGAFPSRWVP